MKIETPRTIKEVTAVAERVAPQYKAVVDAMFEQMIIIAAAVEKNEPLSVEQMAELATTMIDCEALTTQVKAFALSVQGYIALCTKRKAGESISDERLMSMKVQGMPS